MITQQISNKSATDVIVDSFDRWSVYGNNFILDF